MKFAKSKILMALVMMIAILSTTTAFAATPTPRWSYIASMSAYMEVDDSNWATVTVLANGDDRDLTSIKAKCQLQKLDGSWKTIKTWTETNKSSAILYSKNYAIAKNYSYRLRLTVYAYQGSTLLESATVDFDYGYYN